MILFSREVSSGLHGDKVHVNFLFCLLVSFFLFRAAPTAYGSSQARGQIGAAAVNLRDSHRKVGFKPHLQPTPQLTATLDP